MSDTYQYVSERRPSLGDWDEIWDENTNLYYYYNPYTQISDWTHPSHPAAVQQDQSQQYYDNNYQQSVSTEQQSYSEADPNAAAGVDLEQQEQSEAYDEQQQQQEEQNQEISQESAITTTSPTAAEENNKVDSAAATQPKKEETPQKSPEANMPDDSTSEILQALRAFEYYDIMETLSINISKFTECVRYSGLTLTQEEMKFWTERVMQLTKSSADPANPVPENYFSKQAFIDVLKEIGEKKADEYQKFGVKRPKDEFTADLKQRKEKSMKKLVDEFTKCFTPEKPPADNPERGNNLYSIAELKFLLTEGLALLGGEEKGECVTEAMADAFLGEIDIIGDGLVTIDDVVDELKKVFT